MVQEKKHHKKDYVPDEELKKEISRKEKDGKITCIVATEIAHNLKRPMIHVGMALDYLKVKIVECQLGLFGYYPQKKLINPEAEIDQKIKLAIEEKAKDGKLSCIDAWVIADKFSVSKLVISSTAEALGIKISSCQLGAF